MSNAHAQNPDHLFMIEQAVKAPSGHNTQPWSFKINDNHIEIHPNLSKSLPAVDPDNRELFISLGCATENLCIAASVKGYDPEVFIADNGIITINLIKKQATVHDSLFKQIAIRQTNRSVYNGKIIPVNTIDILKMIPFPKGINMYFYQNGTQEFDSISNYVVEGNRIQMQDRAFTDELKSWMRFNKKHQDKTNDGLSYAVFGAPNLPLFIVKPIMAGYLNDKTQNKGDIRKMRSSSHFVLFTTQANTLKEWINLGRYMERFLLKSTELEVIYAYLNQPNEIRDLSEQMAESLHLPYEYPTILLRLGYGEKVPYSKRKDIQEVLIENQINSITEPETML